MYLTPSGTNLLGTVLMTEIREAIRIDPADLDTLWRLYGFDEKFKPKPRSPRDAFRYATPRRQTHDNLTLIEYRGPARPSHYSLACILLRSSDRSDAIALNHHDRAVIALTDRDELVVIKPGLFTSAREEAYLQRIQHAYREALTMVDGSQIRSAISRLIGASSAIRFRDGVAMIPATNQDRAEALASFIERLNDFLPTGATPNTVISIGYADTPEQRLQLKDQIRDHIEREVNQKLAEAISYAQRRRSEGKEVGDGRRKTALGDLLALGVTIRAFEQTLSEPLEELKRYLELQKLLIEQELGGATGDPGATAFPG